MIFPTEWRVLRSRMNSFLIDQGNRAMPPIARMRSPRERDYAAFVASGIRRSRRRNRWGEPPASDRQRHYRAKESRGSRAEHLRSKARAHAALRQRRLG